MKPIQQQKEVDASDLVQQTLMETKTVAGVSFVEGFVQHVLPTGLMKIRHYGWIT